MPEYYRFHYVANTNIGLMWELEFITQNFN